jgi:UDP-2,3-diacylglucosamine pyrophosphatase LpxH
MKLRYRTVFISDAHLGSRGCQARDLVRFLRCIECETLFLVGDIIDFWRLRKKGYWPSEHNDALQQIFAKVREGTRVIYIPGNHDEAARQYFGLVFGGVLVLPHAEHHTVDGRRLLVTHGDQYDLVIRHSRMLALAGSAAYEWLIAVNRLYNRIRVWRGKPYWSLSQYLKHKVKSACTHISRFEEALVREARRGGMHGVVCGHIHKAEQTTFNDPADDQHVEIDYYNCGDWVESCSAVVEEFDGRMHVIEALPAIAELVRRERETIAAEPTPQHPSRANAAGHANAHSQD